MIIEKNTNYRLPTRELYDRFMEQAEMQGFIWGGGQKPTKFDGWYDYQEDTIVEVDRTGRLYYSDSCYFEDPVSAWYPDWTKNDMRDEMVYLNRRGDVLTWLNTKRTNYRDDLTCRIGSEYDIIAVYPKQTTPIWERPEESYKVKDTLTREQAEKIGLDLCEVVR